MMPRKAISTGTPSNWAVHERSAALFGARVQKHDDEDEEHHHGARVHDDLHHRDELGAEQRGRRRRPKP